ncbi:MAG: hypothetical protein AAFY72_08500 [Cyanobacteria bacterium J06649_4]
MADSNCHASALPTCCNPPAGYGTSIQNRRNAQPLSFSVAVVVSLKVNAYVVYTCLSTPIPARDCPIEPCVPAA